MPITEIVVVPLEGEQAIVFQKIDEREQAAIAARTERNAMVTAILAGKGLLAQANETPGLGISVGEAGITLTPPATTSNPAATPE